MFTRPATQWRARPLDPVDVEQFRDRAREARLVPLVAHASYLINLATAEVGLRRRSIAALLDELARAAALGLGAVVVHPGASGKSDEREGLARVADALGELLATAPASDVRVLLEHTAGQGTTLGYRFEHLAAIIQALGPAASRVGVCLDTCHLVAAGYDLATPAGYARTLQEFDAIVGLDRLMLLHLNDSKGPLGSRRDRHEHIGCGHVGRAGFWRLLHDPRLARVPMLIETPKSLGRQRFDLADQMDRTNLARLRRLLTSPVEPGRPRRGWIARSA